MDSPLPALLINLVYYIFVTRLGPKLMKNRPAFNLRSLILTYNALQVILNVGILFWAETTPLRENWFCMRVYTSDEVRNALMPPIGYAYYMMKFLDMADTIFFVLTKKQHFVTALHLFHHTSMVGVSWFGVKYLPSGALAIAPYLNTWVHAIMYAYYFCTLYYGKLGLKWKKLMTSIQLVQFLLGTTLFIAHLLNPWCDFPKLIMIPVIMHGLTFIYMFGNFYYQNYVMPKKQ